MDWLVHEDDFKRLSRRSLLKLAPVALVGVLAIPKLRDSLLEKGLSFNDWASSTWFRAGHLAPIYPEWELTPLAQFPLNSYDVDDPEIDLDRWTLKVTGEVRRSGEYTLQQIQALPRVRQNTRHVCVEGWDVIGRFGGARISDFLNLVGANVRARFLSFECADGYYESLDMATATHPQSLLCYEMYDRPLTREHGAPLRLSLPTKIGYKSAKYLTGLRLTNLLARRGYWEDQGYSWFYGL